MLLNVNNVSARYGGVEALRSISLEVEKGEIVAVLGPNGAGKSTIVRAVLGLKQVSSGEITFENRRIDHLNAQKIFAAGIASVPEQRRLFFRMNVVENLQMGANNRKDKEGIEASIKEVFELFPRLLERKNQEAGTLSGGEQQMLAMARAIMAKPKLMVLDEPSLGLAPLMIANIFEIIKHAKNQGIAVLVAEQNARQAFRVADRVYILELGKFVLSGTAQEMMKTDLVKNIYMGA
jgi:branched-chain amino acid transport system ATP-binding protein